MSELKQSIAKAAELIAEADALIITAGAGIGVDSGLPDFRGKEGFWSAYPALGRAGISFESIACPQSFVDTPELAWGFYGHRLSLYRATEPHNGFQILRNIALRLPHGSFVFTSNVDGHFQKAQFDEARIIECHGSIHYLQCLDGCEDHVWSSVGFNPEVNEAECRILSRMPLCNHCRNLARPNILMFNDWNWLPHRKYEQQVRYRRWRAAVTNPVVIEIGAGTAIPSVRRFGEEQECPLIRINPREYHLGQGNDISLALGGLAGLVEIAEGLDAIGFFEKRIQDRVDSEEW